MRILVALFFMIPCFAQAETFRVNPKISSEGQDIAFLIQRLSEILEPAGYKLDPESIGITEHVAYPGLTRPVIIETPTYAVRWAYFFAEKDSKRYRGSTHFIIIRHDRSDINSWKLNKSRKVYTSPSFYRDCSLILSGGFSPDWFPLEVRLNNLNLYENKPPAF